MQLRSTPMAAPPPGGRGSAGEAASEAGSGPGLPAPAPRLQRRAPPLAAPTSPRPSLGPSPVRRAVPVSATRRGSAEETTGVDGYVPTPTRALPRSPGRSAPPSRATPPAEGHFGTSVAGGSSRSPRTDAQVGSPSLLAQMFDLAAPGPRDPSPARPRPRATPPRRPPGQAALEYDEPPASSAADRERELDARLSVRTGLEGHYGSMSDTDWARIQDVLMESSLRNTAGVEQARVEAKAMSPADALLHVGRAASGLRVDSPRHPQGSFQSDSLRATPRNVDNGLLERLGQGHLHRTPPRAPMPVDNRGAASELHVGRAASGLCTDTPRHSHDLSRSDSLRATPRNVGNGRHEQLGQVPLRGTPPRAPKLVHDHGAARELAETAAHSPGSSHLSTMRSMEFDQLAASVAAETLRRQTSYPGGADPQRQTPPVDVIHPPQPLSPSVHTMRAAVSYEEQQAATLRSIESGLAALRCQVLGAAPREPEAASSARRPQSPPAAEETDVVVDPFTSMAGPHALKPKSLSQLALARSSSAYAPPLAPTDFYGGGGTRAAAGHDAPRPEGARAPPTDMARVAAATEAHTNHLQEKWGGESDARKDSTGGTENKHLLLALFFLQGTGQGELAFEISATGRNVLTQFKTRLRCPLNVSRSVGVDVVVSLELLHWFLSLQTDKVQLRHFRIISPDLMPTSMPAKATLHPAATSLADVRDQGTALAHVIGLLWSMDLGRAFSALVTNLEAIAKKYRWPVDLYGSYVVRAFNQTADSALNAAGQCTKWVTDAGHMSSSFSALTDLASEFNSLTNAFKDELVDPLKLTKGPTSFVATFLEEQHYRGAFKRQVEEAADEARAATAPADSTPSGGARARGDGGPAEALESRSSPRPAMVSLTSAKERKDAALAVRGRCLNSMSSDGCPYAHCQYSHESPKDLHRLGPATMVVLAAGGGPRGSRPLAPEERPDCVSALRRLTFLARGHPGPTADAAATRLPGEPHPVVVLTYKAMALRRCPWLGDTSPSVQALVYDHGCLAALRHPTWTFDEVEASTAAALGRSTLPGSDNAAARLAPEATRARGTPNPPLLQVSTLTGEPLVKVFASAVPATGMPAAGDMHAFGEACRLMDHGEDIDGKKAHCVVKHLAVAVGVRPRDLTAALYADANEYLRQQDFYAQDMTLGQLQGVVLAHDFRVAARVAPGEDRLDVSFDAHLARYFRRDIFRTRRLVLLVVTPPGVEVHALVGSEFEHGRRHKSSFTSYFLLNNGHCQLFNPPSRFGGAPSGTPFRAACLDEGGDAWLATVASHGLSPRVFAQYDANTDSTGVVETASLGVCSCCGIPIRLRLGAAGRCGSSDGSSSLVPDHGLSGQAPHGCVPLARVFCGTSAGGRQAQMAGPGVSSAAPVGLEPPTVGCGAAAGGGGAGACSVDEAALGGHGSGARSSGTPSAEPGVSSAAPGAFGLWPRAVGARGWRRGLVGAAKGRPQSAGGGKGTAARSPGSPHLSTVRSMEFVQLAASIAAGALRRQTNYPVGPDPQRQTPPVDVTHPPQPLSPSVHTVRAAVSYEEQQAAAALRSIGSDLAALRCRGGAAQGGSSELTDARSVAAGGGGADACSVVEAALGGHGLGACSSGEPTFRAPQRLGLPKKALSVISLRSGGASAMFHEGYSAEEIMHHGRWCVGAPLAEPGASRAASPARYDRRV